MRRSKLSPRIRKCDPIRLYNNVEEMRKQAWEYTFENTNEEALLLASGIKGCINRAAIPASKRKSKAWFTNKHYELHHNVKIAYKRYRENPIKTNAKVLVDAKKDSKKECRMAKNSQNEKREKLLFG